MILHHREIFEHFLVWWMNFIILHKVTELNHWLLKIGSDWAIAAQFGAIASQTLLLLISCCCLCSSDFERYAAIVVQVVDVAPRAAEVLEHVDLKRLSLIKFPHTIKKNNKKTSLGKRWSSKRVLQTPVASLLCRTLSSFKARSDAQLQRKTLPAIALRIYDRC